mmetsp:Transcript_4555/g.15158  ORF Transcript_4555/g.15158 Transcript_4555/m.15158 type:complete len:265 (-) Transcript_4555:2061-2855(-)
MGGSSSKEDSYEAHVLPHRDLEEVWPRVLWRVRGSLSFPLPRNMLMYRLSTGKLLIWSAIAVAESTVAAIQALGPIEVLVVPSSHHTLDAMVFKARVAPEASLVCPESERETLAKKGVLCDGTIEALVDRKVGVAAALSADGMPEGGELALILDLGDGLAAVAVCDLLFNILDEPPTWFGRFVGRHLFGSLGPLHVTKFGKRFFVKDRDKLATWLTETLPTTISNLGFRDLGLITVAHGDPVTSDCRRNLQLAADRLLDKIPLD